MYIKTTAAKNIYMKDISEVTKDERYLAKRTGHAANYGMGEKRFMDVLAKDDVFLPSREPRLLAHCDIMKVIQIYEESIIKKSDKNLWNRDSSETASED